jgi:hypothetical protein
MSFEPKNEKNQSRGPPAGRAMETLHSDTGRHDFLTASTILVGGTAALEWTGFPTASAEAIDHTLGTKESRMNRMSRNVIGLLVLALLACTVWSVTAGEQDPDLSGTVTITATSVAAGIGWSWGTGELTLLDGSQHPFKVSGLDVVAVGIKQATGVGNVYRLKQLADFEGKYVKVAAGIAVGGGVAATTMQNDKGVVISLTAVGQGVDFRLAVSGLQITLVK